MKFKDHRYSQLYPYRGEETEAQRKEEGRPSSESVCIEPHLDPVSLRPTFVCVSVTPEVANSF